MRGNNGAVAIALCHFLGEHESGIQRQSGRLQRIGIARPPTPGKIHALQTVDQANAAMAQINQEPGCPFKGAFVVHVQPAVIAHNVRGAAMHCKGQANLSQQPDPGV